ncbi:MAG: hypothetical protein LUQ71_10135 [Methanoregula sp.]|nr:hypothetical protein [Methanoregula sp.]
MTTLPGPTLADTTGSRRLRKLQDRRLVMYEHILEDLDKLSIIEHEIKQLKKSKF